jgi:hypothetical protein
MRALSIDRQYLLRPLQLAGSRPYAQVLEQGYVELGVDAAVEVSASGGYTPIAFQATEMSWRNTELLGRFAYVKVSCFSLASVHVRYQTSEQFPHRR